MKLMILGLSCAVRDCSGNVRGTVCTFDWGVVLYFTGMVIEDFGWREQRRRSVGKVLTA